MKLHYLIFFIIFSVHLSAQNERVLILGEVENDTSSIENVHIVNLNSNIGTLSNAYGTYKIPVKLNDSILFSNIQYETKTLIITEEHLIGNPLKVSLKIKNNQLDEVIVDFEIITKGVNATTLKLPNANKVPLNQLDRKLNYYSQAPTALVILATLLGQKGGIDDMYNIISGNRKKDRRLKHLIEEDKKIAVNQEYIHRIRIQFQDEFFIRSTHIPKVKINTFIAYCLNNEIIFLFDKGRYIEIMNILLNESQNFMVNDQITHLTKD